MLQQHKMKNDIAPSAQKNKEINKKPFGSMFCIKPRQSWRHLALQWKAVLAPPSVAVSLDLEDYLRPLTHVVRKRHLCRMLFASVCLGCPGPAPHRSPHVSGLCLTLCSHSSHPRERTSICVKTRTVLDPEYNWSWKGFSFVSVWKAATEA